MRGQRKPARAAGGAAPSFSEDLIESPRGTLQPRALEATEARVARLKPLWITVTVVLLLRALQLQIADGSLFRAASEENRVRELIERSPRGIFLDRAGAPLVRNVPRYELAADPPFLPKELRELVEELRVTMPTRDLTVLEEKLRSVDRTVTYLQPLLTGLTHQEYLAIQARAERLPGLRAEASAAREYSGNGALAHVLGYTGYMDRREQKVFPEYERNETIGKAGLERQYESMLRGRHGVRRVEVTARGNIRTDLGSLPPTPGVNLRLHLDRALQERVTEALAKGLAAASVQRGAAVVLDPFSGAVRSLVSLPTYSNTLLARGGTEDRIQRILADPHYPLLNRVTQGQYVPGSTFKPLVAAAALEEEVTTASRVVNSVGGIRTGAWFFPDWKAGGHGRTDIVKALAESVNSYFYTIGGGLEEEAGLGIRRITTWARRFGLGERTGVDLPEEQEGFLPSPEWKESTKKERWYIGDTYHAAIGQGDILLTPLQLVTATAALANGGTLYAPRLLDAVEDQDGAVRERIPPVIRSENVISDTTAAIVRSGMRAAVTSGSARGLGALPVPVAAKTGTAQVGGVDRPHAWVAVIAPAERPELVLVVLLEGAGGGDRFAVPVARDILAWYFSPERRAPR